MYLVDTNVISELRNPRTANRNVVAWDASVSPSLLYVSIVSIMELEIGVRQKEHSDVRQGQLLRDWLENKVLPAFSGRILPIDLEIARRCAALHVPHPRPLGDALISATALVHGMTVVTRDEKDFQPTGVALLNPWEPQTGRT
jgi:predicted nucleic acid-binding protein